MQIYIKFHIDHRLFARKILDIDIKSRNSNNVFNQTFLMRSSIVTNNIRVDLVHSLCALRDAALVFMNRSGFLVYQGCQDLNRKCCCNFSRIGLVRLWLECSFPGSCKKSLRIGGVPTGTLRYLS